MQYSIEDMSRDLGKSLHEWDEIPSCLAYSIGPKGGGDTYRSKLFSQGASSQVNLKQRFQMDPK